MLPSCLSKGRISEFPEKSVSQGMKIVGLADAVEGRINVTVNNGQVIGPVGLLLS
jgi:anaphase-promoting complex subunit 1